MSDFTLRRATHADAANLAALGALVWLHSYSGDGLRQALADYVLARFTVAAKRTLLADASATLWLAEQGGLLLGYATLRQGRACPGASGADNELDTLYVHPRLARHGIGRALLAHARAQAAGGLWLSVWQHNAAAIAFYHAQGLRPCGESWFALDGEQHRNLLFASD